MIRSENERSVKKLWDRIRNLLNLQKLKKDDQEEERWHRQNDEEQWKKILIAIGGKPWPDTAVVWEQENDCFRRWDAFRADYDGLEADKMQEFYRRWKEQRFPQLEHAEIQVCRFWNRVLRNRKLQRDPRYKAPLYEIRNWKYQNVTVCT